ncbi:MAG: RNA polymerase sigma factor [Acidobacteriota bacterium]
MRTASNEALSGTSKFLERLFANHERSLFRFFRRRLRSDEDARDASQEVFLRLAQPGARQAAEGRERAYVFTIARNLLIDQHRRREARGIEASFPPTEVTLPAADDTEQQIIVHETVQVLRRGLSTLEPEDREVFVLHRFGNFGYRQIAAKIGISERTVERRMSRALSHLRRVHEQALDGRRNVGRIQA